MRNRSLILGLAIAAFAGTTCAAENVPAEYRGKWVPEKGTCEAPAHMLVAADEIILVNGRDRGSLGDIKMAGPGYFPPDYTGIQAVLITEFKGQQPATATFNAGEEKGVAQVEFSPVQPGRSNPAMAVYNARISGLNLAKRFPLDKVLLRQCPP